MFTIEDLKATKKFIDWIGDDIIVLIHNVYWEDTTLSPVYIIIHFEEENNFRFMITRFFLGGGKLHVSLDYTNLTITEAFEIVLSKYSKSLA